MRESRFYVLIKPMVPKPLRGFVLRNQKILSYLVFGALTTAVNFIIYFPVKAAMGYLTANVIAWVGAVDFAFVTNKIFVFEDRRWDCRAVISQAGSFAAARLTSLGVEEGVLFIFVEVLELSENWTKLIAQVIVLIMNYVFSNLVVFRK